MTFNELKLDYDGVCIYATTFVRARVGGVVVLAFVNLLLLAAIILFMLHGIIMGALVFSIAEIFMIRYSLWNIYGEERIIVNVKCLSYQQYFGFFTTPFKTIDFNMRIFIASYEETGTGDNAYTKFLFISYDDKNLRQIIYHSVLHIPKPDFERFVGLINTLFLDEMVDTYEMPAIYLN